jgi:hypothetical protein
MNVCRLKIKCSVFEELARRPENAIEVDETYVGGEKTGKQGRELLGKNSW